MKYLVVIFDKVSDMFSAIITFENEGCAKRYFNSKFIGNPDKDDFELYHIGLYDDKLGKIELVPNNRTLIMKGSEINA